MSTIAEQTTRLTKAIANLHLVTDPKFQNRIAYYSRITEAVAEYTAAMKEVQDEVANIKI